MDVVDVEPPTVLNVVMVLTFVLVFEPMTQPGPVLTTVDVIWRDGPELG